MTPEHGAKNSKFAKLSDCLFNVSAVHSLAFPFGTFRVCARGQKVLNQLGDDLDIDTIAEHAVPLLQRGCGWEGELALQDRESHQLSDLVLGEIA